MLFFFRDPDSATALTRRIGTNTWANQNLGSELPRIYTGFGNPNRDPELERMSVRGNQIPNSELFDSLKPNKRTDSFGVSRFDPKDLKQGLKNHIRDLAGEHIVKAATRYGVKRLNPSIQVLTRNL